MTLLDLVRQCAARLQAAGVSFGHGTTNAEDEAAWLVLWALQLPVQEADTLETHGSMDVPADGLAKVQALLDRRISSRQPLAYLTGQAWLQGVLFEVDPRVIVPRSLIAEPLVNGTLDSWLSDQTHQVLDLCTGNGSLAVLAAMAWPDVKVHATDLSAAALAVAERNVQRHGLQQRITLAQGDGLAAAPGQWDLILCNPPYVTQAAMERLPPEYKAEPTLALAGGTDGMDFIRQLMATVHEHLTPHGVLVLEVGHERAHFEDNFRRINAIGLPTSAGDDQVLLIEQPALAAHARQTAMRHARTGNSQPQ
jgi:ribosomal protein L3 glutamine methyltransferase